MSNTLKIEDLRIGQAVEVRRRDRWLPGTVVRLNEAGAAVRLAASADRETFGPVLVCGADHSSHTVGNMSSMRLPPEQAADETIDEPQRAVLSVPEFNAGERVVYLRPSIMPNMPGVVESGTCVNGRWSYAIKLDTGHTVGHVRAHHMQREGASIGERFTRAIDEAVGKAIEPLMLRQGTQRAIIDTTRAELRVLSEDVQRHERLLRAPSKLEPLVDAAYVDAVIADAIAKAIQPLRDVLERLREVLK